MNRFEITTVSPETLPAQPVPSPSPRPLPFLVRKFRAVFFVLGGVLVVRAIFIEPFSVPTGSMAPNILGVHREKACWNCGLPVRVDDSRAMPAARFFDVACPNCGARRLELADQPPKPGDRLLVDKTAFGWRLPQRWELAVFRGPMEPDQPFVKRIAGLGGETITIRDGDVFVNGQLARKTLQQAQVACVPICRMSFVPADGWSVRWAASPGESAPRSAGAELVFPLAADDAWREVAYQQADRRPIDDSLTYNGRRPDLPLDWVHDFLIDCELVVTSGEGVAEFILNDGGNDAVVALSPSSTMKVSAGDETRAANHRPVRIGTTHRLEFAFVDRRVTVRLDGAVVGEPIDLSVLVGRQPVVHPIRIRAQRLALTIRNLRLCRDLHYAARGRLGNIEWRTGPNEYFMLGDNTDNSEDSRFWPKPGVPAGCLIGKPFFRYVATNVNEGVVFGRAWGSNSPANDRFGWVR